jgi:hypothetical protein
MTPRIQSGDSVKILRCLPNLCRVDDIVYAKVRNNYYLHLLTAIEGTRYQISNNHGHVNGWTEAKNIFGICVQVGDKVLLTEDDLEERRLQVLEKIEESKDPTQSD